MRLLVTAGGAAESAEAVPESIGTLVESASEILVVAPTLPNRLEWLVSATDKAREQADERLGAVLGQLDELGASDTQGAVGADDPMLAFEESVAAFEPDHILVALRGADRAGWQERGLLDDLVERFSLPVTVFVAPE
jgi:hypothetical protein